MALTPKNATSILSVNTPVPAVRIRRVQVFHTLRLQGNRASVILTNASPAHAAAQALSLIHDSEPMCWVWPQSHQLHVRCYHAGQLIRFCGHGLLASVHTWHRYNPQQSFPLSICSEGREYVASCDREIWLHCARLRCRRTDTFPAHWFNRSPEDAAQAGGDEGYWIFRWARGTDLRDIGPRLNAIARETRRGVIATAAVGRADRGVALRYFAPAYGQQEDSATGSAAVVLADYWGHPSLRLEQHSASGGLLKTRLSTRSVALSGAVRSIHEKPATE